MKISYGLAHQNFSDKNGYGYAAKMMLQSLGRTGHEGNFLDSTAPVQIWFSQPEYWTWHPGQYRIAYLPWESTGLPDGWADAMNEVDEVWTPSPVVAQWFEDAGVKVPIKVYQHGVDPCWGTYSRTWRPGSPFRVFHHGAEAKRKNADMVGKAFYEVFPEDSDGRLTFKMNLPGFHAKRIGRTHYLNERLELDDLVNLYIQQHVYVYPSYGEGFGLTPLQAVATGMPILITRGWAPYEQYLPDEYLIDSKLGPSPWPDLHPGEMWHPDYNDLVDKLTNIADDYRYHAEMALGVARRVKLRYDWETLTQRAFSHLNF